MKGEQEYKNDIENQTIMAKKVGFKSKHKSKVTIYKTKQPFVIDMIDMSKPQHELRKIFRSIHEEAWENRNEDTVEVLMVTPKFTEAKKFMKNARVGSRFAGKKKSQYEPRNVVFEKENS